MHYGQDFVCRQAAVIGTLLLMAVARVYLDNYSFCVWLGKSVCIINEVAITGSD